MSNFEKKFEASKIPEYYSLYFDYKQLKTQLAQSKCQIKGMHPNRLTSHCLDGLMQKLPGYYVLSQHLDKVCVLKPSHMVADLSESSALYASAKDSAHEKLGSWQQIVPRSETLPDHDSNNQELDRLIATANQRRRLVSVFDL